MNIKVQKSTLCFFFVIIALSVFTICLPSSEGAILASNIEQVTVEPSNSYEDEVVFTENGQSELLYKDGWETDTVIMEGKIAGTDIDTDKSFENSTKFKVSNDDYSKTVHGDSDDVDYYTKNGYYHFTVTFDGMEQLLENESMEISSSFFINQSTIWQEREWVDDFTIQQQTESEVELETSFNPNQGGMSIDGNPQTTPTLGIGDYYEKNTLIDISASPSDGYEFGEWDLESIDYSSLSDGEEKKAKNYFENEFQENKKNTSLKLFTGLTLEPNFYRDGKKKLS